MSEKRYRVKEFARLGGITVRTLHYYDSIGILKPVHVSEAGHRIYDQSSFTRLQHILVLKWLGFSLEHIRDMLMQPDHDLMIALKIQQDAVNHRIQQLQQIQETLDTSIDFVLKHQPDALPLELFQQLIEHLNVRSYDEWAKEAYSDEAWQIIETRRWSYDEADIEAMQKTWEQLYADFKRIQHLDVNSEPVQQLAAQMHRLVESFTASNPELESGLTALWSNPEDIPEPYQGFDRELTQFMNQALMIYQQKH